MSFATEIEAINEVMREARLRVAELERELESARSLAVDRDQRLARIAELIDSATVIPVAHESGRTRIVNAWRIARGLEEENA